MNINIYIYIFFMTISNGTKSVKINISKQYSMDSFG